MGENGRCKSRERQWEAGDEVIRSTGPALFLLATGEVWMEKTEARPQHKVKLRRINNTYLSTMILSQRAAFLATRCQVASKVVAASAFIERYFIELEIPWFRLHLMISNALLICLEKIWRAREGLADERSGSESHARIDKNEADLAGRFWPSLAGQTASRSQRTYSLVFTWDQR